MHDRIRFIVGRLKERLWIKPLAMCMLSIATVWGARLADHAGIERLIPRVSSETIESLLQIIASSMLVIATFAVGSMVSSYASASATATPRSFSLVVSDDVSQNALSGFIGAFIFSIVGFVSLKNGFFGPGGEFALFCLTLFVFAAVILTFVHWVDRIARLGRLGSTISKVEAATASALEQRRCAPTLGGMPVGATPAGGRIIYADAVGYVQRVDVAQLQRIAAETRGIITVAALPGTFAAPGRALAHVSMDSGACATIDTSPIVKAFVIGDNRTFEEDPRFGLVVLSEIASRALSTALNDSGTAIEIIGTLVRLFSLWGRPLEEGEQVDYAFDRVAVPELSVSDMFDDAFTSIARDGAGAVEVSIRLQKAFRSLALLEDEAIRDAATRHARLALSRAEGALEFPDDRAAVRKASLHDSGSTEFA